MLFRSGPFGDGIVVDYDYSNSRGRVSVGANDSLTLYTGGVGTIPIMTITQYGFVGIGTTNPIYPVSIIANGATTTTLAGAIFDAEGAENATVQLNIRNARNGVGSSSDLIATADIGTDVSNYIDVGINSSNYAQPGWTISGATDGYVYTSDSNLTIGTANTTDYKRIGFHVGGTLAGNEVMRIQDSPNGANVGIGRTDPRYKVDVVGTVNASNVLVNGAPLSTAAATSSAYNTANAAFGYANSLNTYVSVTYSTIVQMGYAWNASNAAFDVANAAFAKANTGSGVGGGYFSGNNGDKGQVNNGEDRKSTRLNSSHIPLSRMPSSA